MMIEVKGNLWTIPADIRVITTNGSVRKDGCSVMGRGCAREAAQQFSTLPKELGGRVAEHGNRVHAFAAYGLMTLPVKHRWYERADLSLIEQSVRMLDKCIDMLGYQLVVIPRPGCGNGQLSWEMVRPVVAAVLDDRFLVCSFVHEG